jgi:hypothetical protein
MRDACAAALGLIALPGLGPEAALGAHLAAEAVRTRIAAACGAPDRAALDLSELDRAGPDLRGADWRGSALKPTNRKAPA